MVQLGHRMARRASRPQDAHSAAKCSPVAMTSIPLKRPRSSLPPDLDSSGGCAVGGGRKWGAQSHRGPTIGGSQPCRATSRGQLSEGVRRTSLTGVGRTRAGLRGGRLMSCGSFLVPRRRRGSAGRGARRAASCPRGPGARRPPAPGPEPRRSEPVCGTGGRTDG